MKDILAAGSLCSLCVGIISPNWLSIISYILLAVAALVLACAIQRKEAGR